MQSLVMQLYNEAIDVVMLTKNSNKPWFRRVLATIKREIPVHHFIVVDGHSTDGTIDVVREYFGDRVKVIETKAPPWMCKVLRHESCGYRVVCVHR
jgi:glycosyltransferase involved in cell wall biosynthesis